MRLLFLQLVCSATICFAQHSTPTFTATSVLPWDGDRPVPLAPGLEMSIYGEHLGPPAGCQGYADAHARETPNALHLRQLSGQLLVYPKTLCDTQVLVDGVPAGLLYVQQRQINFKVPQQVPLEGHADVRVIYRANSSPPVTLPASQDFVSVYLESPAKVGGPVWLKVFVPGWKGVVSYPFGILPGSRGCMDVEVRRDGKLLPRVADHWPQAINAIMGLGNPCGPMGLPAKSQHPDRIPLHLQYRFDQPGAYEVRFAARDSWRPDASIRLRSPWTPIEILPGTSAERVRWLRETAAQAPTDVVNLLTDYLPSILGIPDAQSLALLCGYLYHPDVQVRQYAVSGLAYWPETEADQAVLQSIRTKGPSDVGVQTLVRPATLPAYANAIIEAAVPYLQSDSPVLLGGAVTALYRASPNNSHVSPALRSRAEVALFAAEAHVINMKNNQILTDYACALGVAHDDRAGSVLWDLVHRNVAREQALIALTWRHQPADLPKIAGLALAHARDRYDRDFSSAPYALHRGYGDAAIPYLEAMVERSEYIWVRTQSARELVLAGRPAGFAFILDAVENPRSYRGEMIQFIRERFPELREADDAALLSFLKSHAVAK